MLRAWNNKQVSWLFANFDFSLTDRLVVFEAGFSLAAKFDFPMAEVEEVVEIAQSYFLCHSYNWIS